ncbi:MAG: FAD binding domain-containing protein [Anaerolineales bacterium]|jgi:carbon-monoxide dehydrogenase medium subunit
MNELHYHRPKSLEEALKLLKEGVPLAGGTKLVPELRGKQAVIDLQDLGLDGLELVDGVIGAGAGLKLQSLVETELEIPEALIAACRLEASLNLRNMASLGGTILSADGRSPLLTTLLALDVRLTLEPGSEEITLEKTLDQRNEDGFRRLITGVRIPLPQRLAYDQVARAPYDRPIVCAAVGKSMNSEKEGIVRIALGGFSSRPVRVLEAEREIAQSGQVEAAVDAARKAYANAEDAWASAEYRGHVAEVLVRRLLTEVLG